MTTAHAFCKIRATVKIRRLRRRVASEKWWGYSKRYTLFTKGLAPPSGVPGLPLRFCPTAHQAGNAACDPPFAADSPPLQLRECLALVSVIINEM